MNVQNVLFRNLISEVKSTAYATHALYMYPAKFIPHIVRYVINKYTKPGDCIFDPFAGYNTIAIEASLTNRNAILCDLNRILHLLVSASLFKDSISLNDFYMYFS
jgi:DNA modification methylase